MNHTSATAIRPAFLSVVSIALVTTILAMALALLVLGPLWDSMGLHVPGERSHRVDFTHPVDGIFYIRNAELGYRWTEPTSIWFHPLLALSLAVLPQHIPAHMGLWLISLGSTCATLIALYAYARAVLVTAFPAPALVLTLLVPGGLVATTGNAEIPCLLFTTLLLLSVVQSWPPFLTALLGGLAILTKPNALYMVPSLAIYAVYGFTTQQRRVAINALTGLGAICVNWALWIWLVDMQAGQSGAYWEARRAASVPLSEGLFSLFRRTAWAIMHPEASKHGIKFVMAFAVPIVGLLSLLVTPVKHEVHRLAAVVGILTMVFICLVTNNPNKVIVYAMTIPGYVLAGVVLPLHCFERNSTQRGLERSLRICVGLAFLAFCAVATVFFVAGTPLEWYF